MKGLIASFLLLGLACSQVLADDSDDLRTVRLKSRSFVPVPNLSALDQVDSSSRHFFAQFHQRLDASTKDELRGLGLVVTRYIPDDTWIVTLAPDAVDDRDLRARLAWVGEIGVEDKLPRRLLTGDVAEWAIQPDGRLELRVRLHDDGDFDAVSARLSALGAELVAPLAVFNGMTILAHEGLIEAVAEIDDVLWISEGLPGPEPENDGSRAATGASIVQAAPYELSGAGVTVGINDGGPIQDHPDFTGRLTLAEDDGAPSYHGTHVAGTVGASGSQSLNQGGTYLQWRGMAPGVDLVSWDYDDDVVAEMEAGVATYDLDVHNNSWGYPVTSQNCDVYGDYDLIAPDLDAIVRGSGGHPISIVFSAGNERDDGDCPLIEDGYGCLNPPKSAKNILVVGATNSDTDTMTEFSSWGPTDDGRIKPDVCAPGCEEFGEGFIHSTLPTDIYGGPAYCGTSMAAPAATGCLALLSELYRSQNADQRPEPALLKALLVATGDDLGAPGPDYVFGHGRINSKDAVDAMIGDTQYVLGIEQDDVEEFTFGVPNGTSGIRVAIAWDDPDAAPLSDPALVNDIDLVLISPNQTEYLPWVLDPQNPSLAAVRAIDSVNNVEQVSVDSPDVGTWVARVSGSSVPQGPQLVSLVGFDAEPPAAPLDLMALNPTEGSLELTWTDDSAVDYEGTLIARIAGPVFWNGPNDGASYSEGQPVQPGGFVAYLGAEDHSELPFLDDELDPGATYTYLAYSFDESRNYSLVSETEGTTEGSSSVEAEGQSERFGLGRAIPNPATTQTEIHFSLAKEGPAQIELFDAGGRRVVTLVEGRLEAGPHVFEWDGTDESGRRVSPGVYFYRLRAGSQTQTRQLSWIR